MAPPPSRSSPAVRAPSGGVRLLAFLAIAVAGLCGGLIGFAVVDLQCGRPSSPEAAVPEDDGCAVASAAGGVLGAGAGAGGVAVVAVLVLRAMAEWRAQQEVEWAGPPGRRPPPP